MQKKALLIGIDNYGNEKMDLSCCVRDVREMAKVLHTNDNNDVNYSVDLLTSANTSISRGLLRRKLIDFFRGFRDDAIIYYSGHGFAMETGAYLVTPDYTPDDPGFPMNDLLTLANRSSARSILIILDCCYSGSIGNMTSIPFDSMLFPFTQLREGIVLMSASGPEEESVESAGHGIFTRLVLDALNGGAADVRGRVTTGAVYSYVDQALNPSQQRPQFKSYSSSMEPVRICAPQVEDEDLRKLIKLFPKANHRYKMDETYEKTSKKKTDDHVRIFNVFKKYRDAGLLRMEEDLDLFYVAMKKKTVYLSALGVFYWRLAKNKII